METELYGNKETRAGKMQATGSAWRKTEKTCVREKKMMNETLSLLNLSVWGLEWGSAKLTCWVPSQHLVHWSACLLKFFTLGAYLAPPWDWIFIIDVEISHCQVRRYTTLITFKKGLAIQLQKGQWPRASSYRTFSICLSLSHSLAFPRNP